MTGTVRQCDVVEDISIHIPRVGDDVCDIGGVDPAAEFQSTSPVWGMTK